MENTSNLFQLRVVAADTLHTIHEESLALLNRTGVVFDSDTIVQRFKHKGEAVDGRRVYLSERCVTAALEKAPRSFVMRGRDHTADVLIGRGQTAPAVAPGNGTVFILDRYGHRRRALMADFDDITRLCEHSRNVSLVGSIPVDPDDCPPKAKPARLVHHLMRYSSKPLIGQAATCKEAAQMFRVIETAFGRPGYLDTHVAIAYSVNPASPLTFEALSCETMQAYAARRQALFILPGLLPGLTGPLDFKGLAVLANAENLAAVTCIQMLNPGTPVVYSAGSMMVNMKNFYSVTGSPQSALVNIAGIQMAREVYGLPARTMAGLSDAKQVDFQAGAETMQNLTLYTLAGAQVINECLGVMDAITTTSFEKWVLDDELLDRLRVFSAGIEQVSLENSLDAMISLGPGANYFQHPGTFQNCRSIYLPAISNWSPFERWDKSGRSDLLQAAHEKCRQILEQQQAMVLPAAADQEISAYLKTI